MPWDVTHAVRPKPSATDQHPNDGDLAGAVSVSWHPTRAQCAVAVGEFVFLLDGATGASLGNARLPVGIVACAHAPCQLGGQLVVLLRDGSVHVVDFGVTCRSELEIGNGTGAMASSSPSTRRIHAPTVQIKKKGLADGTRRGCVAFSGDPLMPWVVFALPGDVTIRAASLSTNSADGLDSGELNSPNGAGSANSGSSIHSGSNPRISESHGGTGSFGASTSSSSMFGRKKAKQPPGLLRIKNEHKKPLACLACLSDRRGTKIAAGYVDGSVRVYDLHTQTTVASFLLPLLVPSKNKPYGTVGPESNQGPSSPNTKLVGLPPPSGIVFLQTGNERNESILVVADVAGRLTSWSTTPKLPTSDGAALHGNGLDMEPPRSTSNRVAIGSELASFASEPGGKKKTPAPPKKPKSGPGGFPSLDMLGGIKGSDGNAPVFSLSGTATGDGVVILAGLRCNNSENSGSAMSEVRLFTVTGTGGFVRVLEDNSLTRKNKHAFPPLPPATHRVSIAAHSSQNRIAVVASSALRALSAASSAASVTASATDPRSSSAGTRSTSSTGGSFVVFFAATANSSNRRRLGDLHQVTHVTTMDTARTKPATRHGNLFYLGDRNSVCAVSLADGPKAVEVLMLPEPPAAAANAAPARLQVAVTRDESSAVGTTTTSPPSSPKRTTTTLVLVLSQVPGSVHASVATLVDCNTGVTVVRVPARDAVFTGGDASSFAALDGDGNNIGIHSCTSPSTRIAVYSLPSTASRLFPGPTPAQLSVATDVVHADTYNAGSNPSGSGSARRQVFAVCAMREPIEFVETASVTLDPGEVITQVAWQLVGNGFHDVKEDNNSPWGGLALLTTKRLVLYEYVLGGENDSACFLRQKASTKNHHQNPIHALLWVGPALVFTHSDGGSILGWDGSVFVLFALGAGGGSPVSIAGATQDAVVLFAETTSNGSGQLVSSSCGNSHSTPAAFFRPVSMCDILVVGWGSLLVSKSGGGRGSQAGLEGSQNAHRNADGLRLIAQRAIAAAFHRHDASRVSADSLALLGDGNALALPGLASSVASRATHLCFTQRACAMAAASSAAAALQLVRNALNKATDPASAHAGGSDLTPPVPGVTSNPGILIVALDACHASVALGDAENAFAAACLLVAVSGGTDVRGLERLYERGVCCGPGGDGGFPVLDALAATKLAPGSAATACAVGTRRRKRIEQKHGKVPFAAYDAAKIESTKAGDQIPLGWSNAPAAVWPDLTGGPLRETSRVSVLTHADALGKRVSGSAPFGHGVEGDTSKVVIRDDFGSTEGSRNWNRSSNQSGFHGGGGGYSANRPQPIAIPANGTFGAGVAATSPTTSQPPPPPFQTQFPEMSVSDSDGEGDPFGDGGGSGDDDPFGDGNDADPFGRSSFASFSPGESNQFALPAPGASQLRIGGAPPNPGNTFQASQLHQGFVGTSTGLSNPNGGAPTGSCGGTASTNANPQPFAAFDDDSADPFGSGFETGGFERSGTAFSSGNGSNSPSARVSFSSPEKNDDAPAFDFGNDSDPFAAAPARNADEAFGVFSSQPSPFRETETRSPRVATQNATDHRTEFVVPDPFGELSDGASDDDDPFGELSDDYDETQETPSTPFPENGPTQNAFGSPLPNPGWNRVNENVVPAMVGGVVASMDAPKSSPVRSTKPPKPAAPVNRTHDATLRLALLGIAALEANDFDTSELHFKAATKLAVTGNTPCLQAAVKCRAYCVASRALRLCKAVAATVEEGGELGEGVDGVNARGVTRQGESKKQKWRCPSQNNLDAALEIARLSRHLVSLPLDFKHRVCVCRFAVVWHQRAGLIKRAGEFLSVVSNATRVASEYEGKENTKEIFLQITRCARFVADGGVPYGAFETDNGTQAHHNVSSEENLELHIQKNERPGWVCAATLRSLRPGGGSESDGSIETNENRKDESINDSPGRDESTTNASSGLVGVECSRCRTAHSTQFVKSGGVCAVCDMPLAASAEAGRMWKK